jgi:hypothetical protein
LLDVKDKKFCPNIVPPKQDDPQRSQEVVSASLQGGKKLFSFCEHPIYNTVEARKARALLFLLKFRKFCFTPAVRMLMNE